MSIGAPRPSRPEGPAGSPAAANWPAPHVRAGAGAPGDEWRPASRWQERLDIALNVVAFLGILSSFLLFAPESRWRSLRFSERGEFDHTLVLVGLDDGYASRYNTRSPVSRAYLADLIGAVARARPRTIALDVSIESPRADSAGLIRLRQALIEAARDSINIILPTSLGGYGANRATGTGVREIRALPEPLDTIAIGGYAEYEVVRSRNALEALSGAPAVLDVPLVAQLEDGSFRPSFPLAAAAAHRGLLGASSDRLTSEGALALLQEFDAPGVSSDNLHGEQMTPLHYEAVATEDRGQLNYLDSDYALELDRDKDLALEGRLVVIAAVYPAPDGSDTAQTPFGSVRGGIVHIYALDTLLRRLYPHQPPPIVTSILALFLGSFICFKWKTSIRTGFRWALTAFIAYIFIGFIAFPVFRLMIPMMWPLWAIMCGSAIGFIWFRRRRLARTEPVPGLGARARLRGARPPRRRPGGVWAGPPGGSRA